ncbi:hypothetical protein [Nonomuraea basaltis]|uniref:hypothetical protein n=1 Tax=Nonomuraea basaltis TaxID=2495887 RepID=UPI00110C5303|nr:hypothetical protein [Nonomuraea basaltis]TMR91990.1 hypothetical protein EJK15_47080 [Nonomuraea basaltis]
MAERAEAARHLVSAQEAHLRAVTYHWNAAMAVMPDDPDFRPSVEHFRTLFRRFAALSNPPIDVVEIPNERASLPGYFLRPAGPPRPRPTSADAELITCPLLCVNDQGDYPALREQAARAIAGAAHPLSAHQHQPRTR